MILKILEIAFVKLIWVIPVIYMISKVFQTWRILESLALTYSIFVLFADKSVFVSLNIIFEIHFIEQPSSRSCQINKQVWDFSPRLSYTFPLKYFAKVWYFHNVHLSWMNEKCDLVVICMSSSSHLLSKLVSFPWTAILIHVQIPVVYCLKVYCI